MGCSLFRVVSCVRLATDGKMLFSVSHGKIINSAVVNLAVVFLTIGNCLFSIDKTLKAHLLDDWQLVRSSTISNLVGCCVVAIHIIVDTIVCSRCPVSV